MNKEKLLVNVSGGRTSALLAFLLWRQYRFVKEMVFVFANTSREKEKTLIFVKNLQDNFGFPVIWVEAVVHFKSRKSCTHKITDFEQAKRKGEVFEEVIKKYGIPNKAFPHCTRELKTNPIRSYLKSIGWGHYKKYTTILGIRVDEMIRAYKDFKKGMNPKDYEFNEEKCQWYPLIGWNITKKDVAAFWKNQNFDLGLADYGGNCERCFKKNDTKIATQTINNPEDTWIQQMQNKYCMFSGGRKISKFPPPYNFFRGNRTLSELMEISKLEGFRLAVDQSMITDGTEQVFIDEYDSCAEGECEPFQ